MPNVAVQRCIVEYCTRKAWAERGIDFCGLHAREAFNGMKPEIEARARVIADSEIKDMHGTLGAQQRRINELEGLAQAARQARQDAAGLVYYLRVGAYLKIGWTADLDKRMRAYSPDSILLATEPGTRQVEQRRHKMFAAHRTHGREWYALVPALMHHIEQLATEHGRPDPVTFAAQPVEIPQHRPGQKVKPRAFVRHVS